MRLSYNEEIRSLEKKLFIEIPDLLTEEPIELNYFELLGFEIKPNFKLSSLIDRIEYLPMAFYDNKINIEKTFSKEFINGYFLKFKFTELNLIKHFTVIIHNELNSFLLNTAGNSVFKYQIIDILNRNFKNQLEFFAFNLSVKQQWLLIDHFKVVKQLTLMAENGLESLNLKEKLNISAFKDKYPVYLAQGNILIGNYDYSFKMYNNAFIFPTSMSEDLIFKFLNEIKSILK